jgi:hypothetical protein
MTFSEASGESTSNFSSKRFVTRSFKCRCGELTSYSIHRTRRYSEPDRATCWKCLAAWANQQLALKRARKTSTPVSV